MKKRLPRFKNEDAERKFWATHDSIDYIDWRKGTGLASSPADKGRDIVCEFPRSDPDGSQHFERYFVDCKHYTKGVRPEKLQSLLAWSHAERPHTALIIASNFLSNPAKDFLKSYESNNCPPFGIKRVLGNCRLCWRVIGANHSDGEKRNKVLRRCRCGRGRPPQCQRPRRWCRNRGWQVQRI